MLKDITERILNQLLAAKTQAPVEFFNASRCFIQFMTSLIQPLVYILKRGS